MRTIRSQISDVVIRKNADKDVKQISDTRYPLKFRYSKDRNKGSWFYVHYVHGCDKWRKIGTYPLINTRRVIDSLPAIASQISTGNAVTSINDFNHVQDILHWYMARTESMRHLSRCRVSTIRSIIDRHLLPRLGRFEIKELTHDIVDRFLIQPMQADLSLSYTRQAFDVLRLAFKQAQKLRLIDFNPIAGFAFGDFISAKIKPRDGRLKRMQLPLVWSYVESASAEAQMLFLMLICHGTRIGETHQARWDEIDYGDKVWSIPGDRTKTRERHQLPITDFFMGIIKRYRAHQEANGYAGVYIFPNHRGGSITTTRASQMLRSVSIGAWSAHDLRKLARTTWADLGVDHFVGERLLNHKLRGLDAAYIHTLVETQKRVALEKYHAWLAKHGYSEIQLNF